MIYSHLVVLLSPYIVQRLIGTSEVDCFRVGLAWGMIYAAAAWMVVRRSGV